MSDPGRIGSPSREDAASATSADNPLVTLAGAGSAEARAARKQERRSERTGRRTKQGGRSERSGSASEPVAVSTTPRLGGLEPSNEVDGTDGAPARPRRQPRDRPSRTSREHEPALPASGSGGGGEGAGGGGGGGRRRPPKPTPAAAQGAGTNVVGIILIVLAVLIGFTLLTKGYDRESAIITAPPTTVGGSTTTLVATSPTGPTPTNSIKPTTTLRPPSQVQAIVGQAGAQEGVATASANKLIAAGYKASAIDSSQKVQASTVYYQPGFDAEAVEVAKVFKIPESSVAAMPNPPPDPLGAANILVLLGPEARSEA